MPRHSTTRINKKSNLSTRLIIQILFLAFTFLIGLRHILPGESSKGGAFDAFCPFGAIETLWNLVSEGSYLKTTSALNISILIGVLGVSLLAGRAFCAWMCPIGSLQDLLARLSQRIFKKKRERRSSDQFDLPYRISEKNDSWLRSLKYLVLAVILLASSWAFYPPLREICPARAVFSFQLVTPLLWSVLIIFLVTSLANQRFWCKYLCPLGAVLAPFNKFAPLRLVPNHERCTNCLRCEAACPMHIPDLTHNLRGAECIQCLECQEACREEGALDLRLF